MLTLLSEVCASLDENPIVTLQFKGQGFQTLYYVLGNKDLQIGDITYLKSNIQVSLPERTNSGFGDINIGICNVNNQVYAAPKVMGEIAGGRTQITGDFTVEEAKVLAFIIKTGTLPLPVRIVNEVCNKEQ